MPLIPFPDIPAVPGVPALAVGFLPPKAVQAISIAGNFARLIGNFLTGPSWGVFFLNGKPALSPDSVKGFEHQANSSVADYPIEAGGFETFNKVSRPSESRVQMTIGSSSQARTDFLITCEELILSIQILNVVTPERVYKNVTLDHFDYRREDRNGASLITVDAWFREVRVQAPPGLVNTQSPSGADPASNGQVSPQVPTPAQAGAFAGAQLA